MIVVELVHVLQYLFTVLVFMLSIVGTIFLIVKMFQRM